jgi:pimeloyl-ACP methyl ester carboxylesterase
MQIDTNGVTLDVQVEGEGRPVVLVHGFPDTKRLWSKQVPALRDAGSR